jgi:hypothetical protein
VYGAYQIVHQTIAPHNDNVLLFDCNIVALGILHRFVARVGAELEGEVEGVLHLCRSEDDLATADQQQTAVANIGNE